MSVRSMAGVAQRSRSARPVTRFRTAALGFFIASWPVVALADDTKAACVVHHEQGQVSRRAGKFDAARQEFAFCTGDVCPAPVRRRCVTFLEELDAAQPTVVVAVHDAEGHDVARGLTMAIDGGTPVEVLATAIRVDPGEHILQIRRGGLAPVERRVVVREGDKERRIDVVVGSEPSLALADPGRRAAPVSTTAWVLVGVSAVAFTGAGVTSAVGWGIHTHLASSCSPACTENQVEPLRVLWPASFVALGVGVVSGAVALTLVLTGRGPSPDGSGFHVAPSGAVWQF
jgi:hypothetical protein